jgi:hypothetical protein
MENAKEILDGMISHHRKVGRAMSRLERTFTDMAGKREQIADEIVTWLMDEGFEIYTESDATWGQKFSTLSALTDLESILREKLQGQKEKSQEAIAQAQNDLDRTQKVAEYEELKEKINKQFVLNELFRAGALASENKNFKPEIEADFFTLVGELKEKGEYGDRVFQIPLPDQEDSKETEKFWQRFRYEQLRHDLLNRPWSENPIHGENLIHEMRGVAITMGKGKCGPLYRDFDDVFLRLLQKKNVGCHILELR